ncbi:hypothetical protein, partial [Vibrio sp.]|uniref:hypothetical protein n=1 Tax=Vibrio sp. TaxID=678 RepID=UPI003D0FFB57
MAFDADDFKRSVRLVGYDSGRFAVIAENKVDPIPGSQEKEDAARETADLLEAARDHADNDHFKEAADKAREANLKASSVAFEDASNVANKAKQAENTANDADSSGDDEDKDAAKTAIQTALNAAEAAWTTELDNPKWISEKMMLKVQLWGVELAAELNYDAWRHIAIIFEENTNGGYTVTLHNHKEDGTEMPISGSLTGQRLPSHKSLKIGDQEANVRSAFIPQMSEFRLWDRARDIGAIKNELKYRKTGEEVGLFYLPLNVKEPGSYMMLAVSEGFNFTIPAFKGELLKRIAERERIILFYGDQVKSLRNNIKDESFNIKLEPKKQTIYDVDLSYYQSSGDELSSSVLHLTTTNGLRINDFATGGH